MRGKPRDCGFSGGDFRLTHQGRSNAAPTVGLQNLDLVYAANVSADGASQGRREWAFPALAYEPSLLCACSSL